MTNNKKEVTVERVLSVIRDVYAQEFLFNGVNRNGLTRKQYYSRLEKLKRAGLVRKRNKRYEITSTGIVMKHAVKLIMDVVRTEPKLSAFDIIREQYTKIPDSELAERLFDAQGDAEILELLLKERQARGFSLRELELK